MTLCEGSLEILIYLIPFGNAVHAPDKMWLYYLQYEVTTRRIHGKHVAMSSMSDYFWMSLWLIFCPMAIHFLTSQRVVTDASTVHEMQWRKFWSEKLWPVHFIFFCKLVNLYLVEGASQNNSRVGLEIHFSWGNPLPPSLKIMFKEFLNGY